MRLAYPVVLEKDTPEGELRWGYFVTFPDLPEAITGGKDRDEAMLNAVDCLDVVLSGRIKERLDIPVPSPAFEKATVSPTSLVAVKAVLYMALRESGMSQAEFARRLGMFPQYVERMLDPKNPTRLPNMDKALAVFGKRLTIGVE